MSSESLFPLQFDSDALAPLLPALRARLVSLFGPGFDPALNHGPLFFARFDRIANEDEDAIPDAPALATIGFALLERANDLEMRRRGCAWLTLFPSLRMVQALAAILCDATEPRELRDQAAWSLAFRQIQYRSDALRWNGESIHAADQALHAAFLDEGTRSFRQLTSGLRHVASPEVLDAMAEHPLSAAKCVDAFATPRLARAFLARLREIGPEDGVRIVRLVGATLGTEAVEALLEYAREAPIAERTEALFAAFAIDPQRARSAVAPFVSSLMFADRVKQRLAWHEANQGVFPTVEALRIARTSACIAPADRETACERAAELFASAHRADMLSEGYLVDLWRHVSWRARRQAPALFVSAIDAAPSALANDARLRDGYLESLAAIGRFTRIEEVAREHGGADRATWLLASHGRPMRALAIRALAPHSAPQAIAGEALALFLAGRPDLATRSLEYADPSAESLIAMTMTPRFPGPEERERITRETEDAPMLRALVERKLDPLFTAMKSAPEGAEPDVFDFTLLARYADAPNPGDLQGATVYLAGRFEDETALRDALERAGAQIVSGPFAKTAFYVRGDGADDAAIAKLEARGAKPLPRRSVR